MVAGSFRALFLIREVFAYLIVVQHMQGRKLYVLRLVEVGNRNDHTRDVLHTEDESRKLRDTAQDIRKALDKL